MSWFVRWYSEGVPYGQLVVVRDGRIVREFFHDLQDPSHNVNRGRHAPDDLAALRGDDR